MHLQHLRPSREGNHQGRALSKGQGQRDHNREDPRDRVRVLLDRGQSLGKDLLVRDLGKVRDHQVRGHQGNRDPDQAKVLLVKDHLGRPPGKVKDHQAKDPQDNKDPGQAKVLLVKAPQGSRGPDQVKALQANKDPDQVKGHLVKGHQVQEPSRVALPNKKVAHHNKALGNLDPLSRGHKALGPVLGSQQRVVGLLPSRELENLQVDSVRCVKPPS